MPRNNIKHDAVMDELEAAFPGHTFTIVDYTTEPEHVATMYIRLPDGSRTSASLTQDGLDYADPIAFARWAIKSFQTKEN